MCIETLSDGYQWTSNSMGESSATDLDWNTRLSTLFITIFSQTKEKTICGYTQYIK